MLAQYATFFTASSQAAATLVGLLFVVLAVDATIEKEFRIRQYVLSETAFISLGGIFILALLALLPSGLQLMAGASILLSIFAIRTLLYRINRINDVNNTTALDRWFGYITVGAYLLLAGLSIWILVLGVTTIILNTFCIVVAILFVISIVRAWRTLIITKRHSS